ncbi:MAG: alpha/beta hydrolase, partial [Zavarzinia sp.]|nr:alpha/beta hydrolase [Zavarzinia sp.]
WIGMQLLMRRPEINGFISISPPASKYDFTFLAPCPSDGLIVQGTADQVVSEPEVAKLATRLSNQRGIKVKYETIEGAGHFFENEMDQMTGMVGAYLDMRLGRNS